MVFSPMPQYYSALEREEIPLEMGNYLLKNMIFPLP
jgi:hypothetical protein